MENDDIMINNFQKYVKAKKRYVKSREDLLQLISQTERNINARLDNILAIVMIAINLLTFVI